MKDLHGTYQRLGTMRMSLRTKQDCCFGDSCTTSEVQCRIR